MDITSIIIAAIVIGTIGILVGLLLGFASEKFKVKVNEKEVEIRAALPGINCGACGYVGCDSLAAAIASGDAEAGACPVGGEVAAKEIAKIMKADTNVTKMVANVRCIGDCEKANDSYFYFGPKDCNIASYAPGGGPKGCTYGCLGFGSCKDACQFDAISMVDGIAVIDKDKCKSCELCVSKCPRHIIEMIPYDAKVVVECNSNEFGKDVKAVCQVGCIGCGICQKVCPTEAIKVEGKLAHVIYDKCIGCGACKEKCPVKVIK